MNIANRSQASPRPDNICGVVITYNPDEKLFERLESLAKQVDEMLLIDNHSSGSARDIVIDAATRHGAHLLVNEENLGIAAALNQGIRFAIDQGSEWVLTMDQDTLASPTMIQDLLTAYNDCPFRNNVGAVGSNYREWNTGRVLLQNAAGYDETWIETDRVVTSGTLIPTSIFKEIGQFCEGLFIDGVDIEYCLRLRSRGFKIIMTTRPCMTHSLGNCEVVNFMGIRGGLWHHPPFRNYYITRNNLLITRRYLKKQTKWVLRNLAAVGCRLLATILFEDSRPDNIRYISLGIYHALISKSGRLREETAWRPS